MPTRQRTSSLSRMTSMLNPLSRKRSSSLSSRKSEEEVVQAPAVSPAAPGPTKPQAAAPKAEPPAAAQSCGAYERNYSEAPQESSTEACSTDSISVALPAPVVPGEGSASSPKAGTATSPVSAPTEQLPAATEAAVSQEQPAAAVEASEPTAAAAVKAAGATQADEAAEDALPDGWEAVTAEDGRVYFWFPDTDEVSWTRPMSEAAKTVAPAAAAGTGAGRGAEATPPVAAPACSTHSLAGEFERKALEPAPVSSVTQRQRALSALERKADRNQGKTQASSQSSQHAEAVRNLQQVAQKNTAPSGPSQADMARRNLTTKLAGETDKPSASASRHSGVGASATTSEARGEASDLPGPVSVSQTKAAFLKANEEPISSSSQRQEALRKLNAKGVVPTRQAFGTASKKGSQHSEAMSKFQNMDGVDAKVGLPKKSDFSRTVSMPAAAARRQGDGSQRAAALAALKERMGD